MKAVPYFFAIATVLVACATNGNADDVKTEIPKVKTVRTFKNLRIKLPVLIDNAGDGSGRLFIASQVGKVFVMDEKDTNVSEPQVFMDIEDKVRYIDRENEEGFLGMAFHPKYKENGYLYVYYTKYQKGGKLPRTSVISRFTRAKNNPDKIDVSTEEQIMTIS